METKTESDSPKQRKEKFKYLTTNMQNLLKNFNDNLAIQKNELNKIDLLKKLKIQPSVQTARGSSITRSKTISNRVDIPRPVSQLDHYYYDNVYEKKAPPKPKINRSQSQLNYNSLQRAGSTYDNPVYESYEDKIRKTRSIQQIQPQVNSSKSSFITDSYNTDSDSNNSSRSTSPSVRKSSQRRTSFIENSKSVILRREKSVNDKDLPLLKQKLMASVKRGQSVLSENRDQNLLNKINELQNRIFVIELELDREKKKLCVEKEEKYELINEIKVRYENEKMSALKALEAKLNTDKLFELNKMREMFEMERKDEFDQKKKLFENEIVCLKMKLREKNERCCQLEKLLKDEHTKSEKLFLKSIEMVRKYNPKTNQPIQLTSIETQTNDDNDDCLRQRLTQIRQTLHDEHNDLKTPLNTNQLLDDIETKSKLIKQLNQTQQLDIKLLKENKLKLESLYKIKCKSDLNKSAKIKKLDINYQTELLKFRNEYNSDLVRYLEDKLLFKDSVLNDNINKMNKFVNILDELDQNDDIRNRIESVKELVYNIINTNVFCLNETNLNGFNGYDINLNNMYKKAPVSLVIRNDLSDFKSNSVIRKIDHNDMTLSINSDRDKRNKSIQDEIMELDKHLIDMKILSNSLTESQHKEQNMPKQKRNNNNDYKSSSNSSSCDISNSSHSFIELEEASDLKFTDKNINLVANKNFKKKPTIELVVQ